MYIPFLKNYVTLEGAVAHYVLYYQQLSIARYRVSFYANDYFELLPIVSSAIKTLRRLCLAMPWKFKETGMIHIAIPQRSTKKTVSSLKTILCKDYGGAKHFRTKYKTARGNCASILGSYFE